MITSAAFAPIHPDLQGAVRHACIHNLNGTDGTHAHFLALPPTIYTGMAQGETNIRVRKEAGRIGHSSAAANKQNGDR